MSGACMYHWKTRPTRWIMWTIFPPKKRKKQHLYNLEKKQHPGSDLIVGCFFWKFPFGRFEKNRLTEAVSFAKSHTLLRYIGHGGEAWLFRSFLDAFWKNYGDYSLGKSTIQLGNDV